MRPRVDSVAEQAEHGRQQRQRGDDRDDPDEDRAVPRLRRIVSGTITIPSSASTNAIPLKSTARLAVAPAAAIASILSRPARAPRESGTG